jgi:two-component system sensor histidine kinase QseC
MRSSIRRLLLINLLVCVALIVVLTAVGVYYLGSNDVDQLMDRELVHSSLVFRALLTASHNSNDYEKVQSELNQVLTKEAKVLDENPNGRPFRNSTLQDFPLQYQIWDKSSHLILQSGDAPDEPLSSGQEGFSTTFINQKTWRVYTSYDAKTGLTFIVGARNALQTWLKQSVAKDDIYIMLLTFPILGILIWLVLAHGLSSLKRVADELATRAPNYLEPVDIDQVPEEIASLVDELNKLLLRLKQTLDREQRFASDAAHELRTPLAALRTHAQVALRATHDPDVARPLNKVMTGVERSTHVVQQLLTLSRLVPGSPLDNQTNVDVVAIARDIISDLIPIALEKNIEISLDSTHEHVTLLANGITIGILLRNLIDNAIRYTPEDGQVSIEILENNDQVTLQVTDNGPGIPPKLRARVFERFFRVLGNKAQGSGLGLAIVQQIAGLHNGHVKLDSPRVGTGLQISVIFSKWDT